MVNVTLLVDNTTSSEHPTLAGEHGLSLYVSFEGLHLLCDTGASALFAQNAQALGVDLSGIDLAVISHAHADHAGGIEALTALSSAPIYVSASALGARYYSTRGGACHEITAKALRDAVPSPLHSPSSIFVHSPSSIFVRSSASTFRYTPVLTYSTPFRSTPFRSTLCSLSESAWIRPKVAMVYTDTQSYERPYGNRTLYVEHPEGAQPLLDDFSHEMALVLRTDRGLVIISSCSHTGVANIVESCRVFCAEERVVAFIGGMHLVEGEACEREVAQLCDALERIAPEMEIWSGHCTCSRAQGLLRERLGERFHTFYCGAQIELL